MILHRFTEEGLSLFSQFLESLAQDPHFPIPLELLDSPGYASPVGDSIEIESRIMKNRMEAARYIYSLLEAHTLSNVEGDAHLWAWLTLYYFNSTCPDEGTRGRKAGERARYIPRTSDYQRYYRHLLAGPYRIFKAHKENPEKAWALLCQPVHRPGDIVEQLASRQEIVTNSGIMEVATQLYYDPEKQAPKRGSQTKKGGAVRRLTDVLNQYDLTWDLYSMASSDVASILPKEFTSFKPKTKPAPEAGTP